MLEEDSGSRLSCFFSVCPGENGRISPLMWPYVSRY